jgi:hypothetical protein
MFCLHAKQGLVLTVEMVPSGSMTQYAVKNCGHILGQAAKPARGDKAYPITDASPAILQASKRLKFKRRKFAVGKRRMTSPP